jgi:hypothetical protein
MRLGGDFFDLEGWAFVMSHLYACNDNDAPGHAFQGSHLCHDGERTGAFCRCMFCMVWESITDNSQRGVCQDLAKQRMKGSTDGQDSIDNGVFCPSKVDTRCTTWVVTCLPTFARSTMSVLLMISARTDSVAAIFRLVVKSCSLFPFSRIVLASRTSGSL